MNIQSQQPVAGLVDLSIPRWSHDRIEYMVDWVLSWTKVCTPVYPSDKNGFIYVWVNTVNGRSYVGMTKDFGRRTRNHFGSKNSQCRVFKRAIEKYGRSAFAPIVRECPLHLMRYVEMGVIAALRSDGTSLYNLTDGGDGAINPLPEVIENRRASQKAFWQSPEGKALHAAIMKKRYSNPMEREKTRLSSTGRKYGPEVREKVSAARKAEWQDPVARERRIQAGILARQKPGFAECHRGERNGSARLKNEDIVDIRARYAIGGISQASIAKIYGVTPRTINLIVTGRTWTHISSSATEAAQ
jgi:group I intron endonuclease